MGKKKKEISYLFFNQNTIHTAGHHVSWKFPLQMGEHNRRFFHQKIPTKCTSWQRRIFECTRKIRSNGRSCQTGIQCNKPSTRQLIQKHFPLFQLPPSFSFALVESKYSSLSLLFSSLDLFILYSQVLLVIVYLLPIFVKIIYLD